MTKIEPLKVSIRERLLAVRGEGPLPPRDHLSPVHPGSVQMEASV